jgi:hypothetical protein
MMIEPDDFEVTGGDTEVNEDRAEVDGEEAVGGTTPTPDQDIVDDIARSAGVETADRHPLRVKELVDRRDDERWELDPDSSEDSQEDYRLEE